MELGAIGCYQFNSFLRNACVRQRRIEHYKTACVFKIALQGQHEPVAVNDAGAGGMQGRNALQCGLQRSGLVTVKPAQVRDAVGLCPFVNALQTRALLLCRGYQQLAAALVAYAPFTGIGVEHVAPLDTQAGLE